MLTFLLSSSDGHIGAFDIVLCNFLSFKSFLIEFMFNRKGAMINTVLRVGSGCTYECRKDSPATQVSPAQRLTFHHVGVRSDRPLHPEVCCSAACPVGSLGGQPHVGQRHC